jgi:Na+/proline symporter
LSYLGTLDYGVILVYFGILVALGVYLSRRASVSLEHYFLGGRELPWWALGISGMASFLDMTGTMVIVSFLYALGPRGLYVEFRGGAVLILIIMLLWTGKWHRRSGCITNAEWMIYRFGEGVGGQFARIISAIAAVIGTVGMLAYLVKGAGLFLSMFFPFSPFWCSVILIGVGTIYTMAAGFYGVVFGDMFQSLFILAGVIAVSTLAVLQVSDSQALATLATQVTGTPDWLSSVPHWHPTMPDSQRYDPYRYLGMVAFFFLLKNLIQGMGAGGEAKYFGARNERECGLLTFFWTWLMTIRWPMMMAFAVLGVYMVSELFPDQTVLARSEQLIRQHIGDIPGNEWEEAVSGVINHPEQHPELATGLQGLLGTDWKSRLPLVGSDGRVNPERILPAVLVFKVTAGWRGLLVICLIAAAVTTFASTVNGCTAFFTRDIYQRYWRPSASTRELMLATYVFGVVLVAGGLVMGWSTTSINDIWGWLSVGLAAGLSVPGMMKFYWWRLNAGGVIIGMIVGMGSAVGQRIWWPHMPEWQQFLILTAIAFAATIAGTYLTRPTDPKVVEHFYRTTRPFGFWGPLKNCLSPDARAAMTREHRNDVLAIPFNLIWHVTLFLLPMQLIIRNMRAFWITLVPFLIGLGGMYVIWYRNLPAAETAGKPSTEYGVLSAED